MRRLLLVGVLLPGLIFWFVPVSYLSRGLGLTPWGFALPDGVIYLDGRKPYVLVALTEWNPDAGGRHRTIARISRAVYEYVTAEESVDA